MSGIVLLGQLFMAVALLCLHICDMDMLGILPVKLHYNGEFIHAGKKLQYCGGSEAMSYIDRDKVSLPEVVGHLKDHYVVMDGKLLHWLVTGKDLTTGLRAMVDDKICLEMESTTEEGFVAEIYLEAATMQDLSDDERVACEDDDEDSDYENEFEAEMEEEDEDLGRRRSGS